VVKRTGLPVLKKTEIEKMSVEERLEAMEMLWESLARSPAETTSPKWHGNVLSSRLERLKSGKAEILTIEQLKHRCSEKGR
jgi:putative addiction module component (TIGR02574 family)